MAAQVIANGFVLGLIIALVALGLNLVYGILRVVNFAHGEFYMLGAIILFYNIAGAGTPYIVALLMSVAIVGILGWVVERLVFRRFHGDLIGGAIAAIALSIGIQAVTRIIFGPRPQTLPSIVSGIVDIFGATITVERLLIVGVAFVVILGMAWFISYTRLGKSMRAVQQDSEAALTLGVSVNFVCGITFAIATSLAALAGGLMAPLFVVAPEMGLTPLMFALIVVVLGGLGSIMGAFWASLIIGFQYSLTATFLTGELAMGIGFGLAILILILRPRGLMGHD